MNKIQRIWSGIKSAVSGINNIYQPGFAMVLNNPFSWAFRTKTSQLTEGYRNKIVFAVVNVLVRKQLEVPIIVSKVVDEKSYRKQTTYNFKGGNEKGVYNMLRAKALEELEKHDLKDLLDKPNNYQVGIEMRQHFWFNYNLSGDGYLWAEIADFGRTEGQPVFLHSLGADRVTPVRNDSDWRNPISYYVFTTWTGETINISPNEIMHMSKWSPLDPILGGWSPQISLGGTMAKNNANEVAQGSAFQNGGTGTIIGSDSIVDAGKQYFKLTTAQVQNIKDTVQNDWAGASNSGKIHVTNGHVTVQKLGDTLVDLNAINANKEDVQFIASGWGVSPILIGDMSGGTDNNVAAAYKALVTNVVVTDLRMFDMKFKYFMKPWYKENIDASHDLTEFSELAPDLKLLAETYGKSWQVTPNEYRKMINMDTSKDPNMDKFYIPSGYTLLDDIATADNFDQQSQDGKQFGDYN